MRRVLALCALLVAAPFALALGLPTNVCFDASCSVPQEQIWRRFQLSPGLKVNLIPGFYSGGCYHTSPHLDAAKRHQGGILIDRIDGRVFFDGSFTFYDEKESYADLTVESARERFSRPRFEPYELELHETYAVTDVGARDDSVLPIYYWFRQDAGSDRLLLVGYLGLVHTVVCELDRHRER